ncbi:MAG: PorP/SprF family type IX secretion system membrane protein [Chitinophagales bacterium]
MKKIFLLLTTAVIMLAAQAQQLNLQSRVYFARLTANPALTAYNGSTNVYGFFRDQWSGALSHPRMAGGIGEISLWNDRIGTGIEVMSYTGGITQIIDAKLYYAQKIKLAQNHLLSIGVAGGVLQHGTNISSADLEMINNDPSATKPRTVYFDMNIGLAYQWKKLTIGFAIPNLLDANTRAYGNQIRITNFKRNYLINGSYEISLAKDKFHLEPGFVMKIDQLKQVNLNLQLMADYKRFIFLGVGYDLLGGLPVTAGVRISKIFTVAYTYQVPLLQGVPFTPSIYSSHELTVGLNFDKWMKKADKVKETAAAPQTSSYDSLQSRATADSLAATRKAVDSLAVKVDALQQALADVQQQSETAARKKEQVEKLDALNKKLEEQQKQQTEAEKQAKAREDAAKAAAEQQAKEKAAATALAEQQAKAKQETAKAAAAEQEAKEKAEAAKAAAVAEQQAKEKAQAAKVAYEAEQQAKAKQEAATAVTKTETPAPVAKEETKKTAQGYEIIAEAPALPAQTEAKAAPQVGERFSLGNISVERDGSKLHESSYAELDKLVNYLKLHKDTRVRIVGHGDGFDIEEQSGFRSYKRARRVAEYLETKGIPFAQFTYVGMGPRKPIADNTTEEGRAKNFRIEVEIIK